MERVRMSGAATPTAKPAARRPQPRAPAHDCAAPLSRNDLVAHEALATAADTSARDAQRRALHAPDGRSCTQRRSSKFTASLAGFGRRARISAATARWWPGTQARRRESRRCDAALWRSSTANDPAVARFLAPLTTGTQIAISSRSANDRYRPMPGASVTDGIPPPSRYHRTPTAADTPPAQARRRSIARA